jgi:hypothetical protein
MKEHYCQVWQSLKTELHSKNKIISLNTIPVPVLVYSFRTVNYLKKKNSEDRLKNEKASNY